MWNDAFYILQFSALVFFNLFCVLGVVVMIFAIATVAGIKSKTEEALEKVKQGADNFGEISVSVLDFLSMLPFGKKKMSIGRIIGSFFRK